MVRYVSERHIVIDDAPAPVPFWNLENEKLDKLVLIIGGGPSHGDLDLELIKNVNFIAVNSACRKVMEVSKERDILYFTDNSWAENYLDLIKSWKGKVVTSNRNTKARLGNLVNRLDLSFLTEFMMVKIDYVLASSGHSATCLAALLGSKRVILIGFENQSINGETHGHKDYKMSDLGPFKERFLPGWYQLAPRFRELGVEVINSTPNSLLKEFDYLDLRMALDYV